MQPLKWIWLGIVIGVGMDAPGALPDAEDAFLRRQAQVRLGEADAPEAFDAAARTLAEAARRHPPDAGLYYNLGTALLLAGDAAGAVAALRRAERWGGNLPGVRRNLALAQAALDGGDPATALSPYRRLVDAHFALALPRRQQGLCLAWTLLWGCLALARRPAWRAPAHRAALVCALVAGLLAFSVGASWVGEWRDRREGPNWLRAPEESLS